MKKNFVFFCLFICANLYAADDNRFILVTTLYNETDEQRLAEYITCLEHNLAHALIKKVHVLYDTSRDDTINHLLHYLQDRKVTITYISGRPTFRYCFDLINNSYKKSKIILSNADIYFNETLYKLRSYDLHKKLIALTRWDLHADGQLALFKQFDEQGKFDPVVSALSQDAWIFKTPFTIKTNTSYQIGTWACDSYLAYFAHQAGFKVINPCLTVQACHMHLSNVRTYDRPVASWGQMLAVMWSKLK